jgi:hypothetical protein
MADRQSAALFGQIFEHCAEFPSDPNKEFARKMWEQIGDFDFDYYQLGCDEALIKLGLARASPCRCEPTTQYFVGEEWQ